MNLKKIRNETLPVVDSVATLVSSATDCEVYIAASIKGSVPDDLFAGELAECELDLRSDGGGGMKVIPDFWTAHNDSESGELNLSVLHNAYVFGGAVTARLPGAKHEYGQLVVTSRGTLIKSSYGIMDGEATLPNELLRDDGEDFDYIGPPDGFREYSGEFLLIGNVHRHFGHALLEGLSRLWALDLPEIKDRNLRLAIYEPSLRPFAQELLDALKIPKERLLFLPKHALLEKIFVPSPAMRTHSWITKQQSDTWTKMSQDCEGAKPSRDIYLSRRSAQDRPLVNEDRVEDFFASRGFEVVCPELLTIQEQIALAHSARSLAGPVGSQMYLAAFQQPGGRNFVLAPRNFYFKDDFLISLAKGHHLSTTFGSCIDFSADKPNRKWEISLDKLERRFDAYYPNP